jgi:hypothetical protein
MRGAAPAVGGGETRPVTTGMIGTFRPAGRGRGRKPGPAGSFPRAAARP